MTEWADKYRRTSRASIGPALISAGNAWSQHGEAGLIRASIGPALISAGNSQTWAGEAGEHRASIGPALISAGNPEQSVRPQPTSPLQLGRR